MSCSPPTCARYTAELVNSNNGQKQNLELEDLQLSWERVINRPAAATITSSSGLNSWCCPWQIEPWCWELHIYRDSVRVGVFDFHSILNNPENGNDVLYFISKMFLFSNRTWLNDHDSSYESSNGFRRVLEEANRCDPQVYSEQQIPIGYTTDIIGNFGVQLNVSIEKLISGTLDYTEFTHGDNINVVRYGDIYYHTGATLVASHWSGSTPSIGFNGLTDYSAVIVTSNSSGGEDAILGFYPKNSDGTLKKDLKKRWLPLVIEVRNVLNTNEANDIAQKRFISDASGLVIQSNGDSTLSEDFPVCLDDLIPGAGFDIFIESGCFSLNSEFELQSLVFDVDGGFEVSVKADFVERSQV